MGELNKKNKFMKKYIDEKKENVRLHQKYKCKSKGQETKGIFIEGTRR